MELQEMSLKELSRQYAALLIEIDSKYGTKKEFEDEFKRRLRKGEMQDV